MICKSVCKMNASVASWYILLRENVWRRDESYFCVILRKIFSFKKFVPKLGGVSLLSQLREKNIASQVTTVIKYSRNSNCLIVDGMHMI